MPKTTAKKKKTPAGKLAGKKVAFVGKFGSWSWDRDRIVRIAKLEGARVVKAEKQKPDILVAGAGAKGGLPTAVAKVQKKHPSVQVVDEADFYRLTTPTADELHAILRRCPRDWEYWSLMDDRLARLPAKIDLGCRDLRKLDLSSADLEHVNLDGADFSGAKLDSTDFGAVRGAKFDGARIGYLSDAEGCSLTSADLRSASLGRMARCDLTGARLNGLYEFEFRADGCAFGGADLSDSNISEAVFKNCDLTGAKLVRAHLPEADFTGSTLSGADLSGAELAKAKFTKADLRNANFTNAHLGGAVFTGATLDGADFAGAILTGANLKGVDASKAKNLDLRPPRAAGPNLKRLAGVVQKSKEFTTTIELTLGKGESVTLQPTKLTHGRRSSVYTSYDHTVPSGRQRADFYLGAKTFEEAMLKLADRWGRGVPRFETITAKGKKCPKKGEELEKLVYAAWCEALGVPVPDDAELEQRRSESAGKRDAFRDKLLAELRGGAAGVAKWNKRDERERGKVGSLRYSDFSNEKMAGVELNGRDLRGAKFDGASLRKALFCATQLQKASFAGANLSGANLNYARCQEANFEGASLVGALAQYGTNFENANFRNADLTNAKIGGANLCGADLTGATAEGADFGTSKYDNGTKFPAGFKPPEKMVWKGTGTRPGQRAVKAAAPGSMDFDAFFTNLGKKVEIARMRKATAMLKAERFQLFADVTDSSLVGVVKSQTSKDLVYSCRLSSDGGFGCGTQNLKPCGGLQGALCKHLLVLIVGLAKAGRIDSATAYAWVESSQGRAPELDKDAVSETFLKHKGAEAGELDWRPTETIPEDFYAM